MKKLITLLLLTISFFVNAQDEKVDAFYSESIESKITSFKFSVNSPKELEVFDWNTINDIFETNKPDDIISISFEIDLKESKNKFKSSTTVSGPTKNLNSLITRAKKTVKSLRKLSIKNQE